MAADPTHIATILGVGVAAHGAVTEVVKGLVGPTATRVGKQLEARLFGPNVERIVAVVTDSVEMLDAAGIQPQPVPGRILFPILEHSSWEEEPDLRSKWASLLANAASPGPANKVLPAFPEILRQLLPQHVWILDLLHDRYYHSASDRRWMHDDHIRDELRSAGKPLWGNDYEILVADLHRLQLIDGRRHTVTRSGGSQVGPTDYGTINITRLGLAFVEACRPPRVR